MHTQDKHVKNKCGLPIKFCVLNISECENSIQFVVEKSREKMFVFILIALVWLLYKWSISNFDYFEKLGIFSLEKPKPLFGNMFGLLLQRSSMVELTGSGYRKFKDSK
jgi:hypothetical protein